MIYAQFSLRCATADMDMYEHAYHMDDGTHTGGYVDAFFRNIQWDEVNRRAEGAHPRP